MNFPAAGAYPYEVDYAKGGDNKLTLTMQAGGAPIPAAALLTLSPAQAPSIAAGQIEQFMLTATDADGVALSNLPVTFAVTGQNAQVRLLVTDGTGQAGFAYAGSPVLLGTDTVQAAAHVNGADAYSNAVVVQWNNGVNQAPVVSAGSPQTITLPSVAILNGTVSDDGLPNNTLTIAWTMQSGPATVTFDNPNQAATAANFTTPGTYVLQLSATDGVLTTNSTVTITVNANTTWNSGWIQSPLNLSTVTGQIPVTLIPGITLVSGTLTYYPTNNSTPPVTIGTNTTGTGQIGTFDTTTIMNGSYWIDLRATNSNNVTQDNLALVTVAGDYKPGRVTATVTDLVVPAAGLAIRIDRTYDSLTRNTVGDFGLGWTLGLNAVQMQTTLTSDVTLTINGQRRTFYFTPQANSIFIAYYSPQYTAEPGMFGSLINTGDNCNGVLQRIGNLYQCAINNAGQFFQATGYQYTDPYGRVYTITPTGNLQSLKDLNGNTLTLSATGITSSTGLSVPFVRDGAGRITQITDPLGHQYQYAYDASGNLSSVTYPGITTPTQYQYDATHLLTQETDQRGNIAASSTFYADGKLKSVTDAVNNTTQFTYDTSTHTTTTTNPDGGTVVTVADAYGMPLTVTDPLGRVTTNVYDANHNQVTMTDPRGKTTTYTYDSNGFRTSLKDPLNNLWSATFNAVGGPTAVTNPLNQTQNVTYDANFRIASITDTFGQVAALTYSGQGLPLTLQDARGNTSNYTYDQYGNRTGYTDPLNRTTTSVFDTQGNLTRQTDPRSNAVQYGYDAYNRRTSMTDAAGKMTQYAYDGNGNKTSETDRNNHQTAYTYDNANRLTQIRYADNTTRGYTYDFRGNKLTETDQLGRVTKYVYDFAGQLTNVTAAFGTADAATTTYTYDLAGRKLTQVDPRGNTTTYAYDDAGRMTSMRDGVGNLTQYAYDAKGQRTSMTDAKNRQTTYSYDARGRKLATTTPDGRTVSKTYDGVGLALTTTDEENRTTSFGYDAASQLLTVTDALGQITQYNYDPAGNKTSQKDARNNTTSYGWDNLNRRISRALPLGQTETFTYDAAGNMQARVDFNGKISSYAYDSLNRLLSRTPDASFGASPVSFTYTATGQRQSMTDASGVTNYTYNNRDQALTKSTPQGTLTYTYDSAGNVTSVVSSNANGTSVSYAYDQNSRLASVTDNRTGGTTNYVYDQTNQLSSMAYPNGVTHGYSYDTRDRTTTLNVTGPGGVLASYTQAFSLSGRKASIFENAGRTENYNYDSIYRLLGENITGDPASANNGLLSYSLDAVGNRNTLTSTLAALQSQSLTYDADDRLTADAYDANGNTIASGGHTFAYEFEDRLTQFDTTVAMTYDGDGNRIVRTQGGSTTRYLVDDLTPTGYAQVAEELVNGSVVAQYTYGLMHISQNRAGTVSYYGYDAGGSVRQLLNSAGVVTDTYAYDAFGNTVAQTGSTVNEFLYRGEQYDAALGLYYLRARYYNPRTGRFLTADKFEGVEFGACDCSTRSKWVPPIGTHHRYDYANADAVNTIDPTGYGFIEKALLYATAFLKQPVVQVLIASGGFLCAFVAVDQRFEPMPHTQHDQDVFLIICSVYAVLSIAATGASLR